MAGEEPAWREHARRLADQLVADGVVTDRRWRDAVADTPRHTFVSSLIDQSPSHPVFLRALYADETLPSNRATPSVAGVSITVTRWHHVPVSATVRALALLDPREDAAGRILVADDPTGYQTALLCHGMRVAHRDRVVLAVPDAGAAKLAQSRLTRQGCYPTVVVGSDAAAARGPFAGVLGGPVTSIPDRWITGLAVGGRIVAPWAARLCTSFVVLDRDQGAPGMVSGRVHPAPEAQRWFVPVEARPAGRGIGTAAGGLRPVSRHDRPRASTVDPGHMSRADLQTLLSLRDTSIQPPQRDVDGGVSTVLLSAADQSWVEVATSAAGRGGYVVREGGPRRIWPLAEDTVEHWLRHDRPGPDRVGLTVQAGHRPAVWIDDPAQPLPDPTRSQA